MASSGVNMKRADVKDIVKKIAKKREWPLAYGSKSCPCKTPTDDTGVESFPPKNGYSP